MLYLSLGSQPVVSSVLKDCNLNTNSTIFDNVGDLSFKTLLLCLNTQFKDFFPPENEIQIYGGIVNAINKVPYYIIRDKRNGTLFYDVLPVGKKLNNLYNGAKIKYERLGTDFTNLIQNTNFVIFIRQMIDDTENDTIELNDTIKYVYPSCKFYVKHKYAGNKESKCYDFWKHEMCRGN